MNLLFLKLKLIRQSDNYQILVIYDRSIQEIRIQFFKFVENNISIHEK